MKIAMLTTWFPPVIVGSGVRFYEIAKRLAKKHQVRVYTTGVKGAAVREEMEGIQVFRFGEFSTSRSIESESSLLSVKFGLELLRCMKNGTDIIDCNIVSKSLPYIAYLKSILHSIPVVQTWHEVWHSHIFRRQGLFKGAFGFLVEFLIPSVADHYIAVSRTTQWRLSNLLGVPNRKITVISNGANLAKFQARSEKRFGEILYAGRLEEHKRVDALLIAYGKLKDRFPELKLVIVGSGPKKMSLEEICRNRNLKDVRLLDPMPYQNLVELMESSWIFVQPSIMEGQGIVLLEAMAAGTPVVGVRAPGSAVREVIRDGENGLLVNRPELVGNAMERLLSDDVLHATLRKNGLEFVKDYDWDMASEKVSELYERITAEYARTHRKNGFVRRIWSH